MQRSAYAGQEADAPCTAQTPHHGPCYTPSLSSNRFHSTTSRLAVSNFNIAQHPQDKGTGTKEQIDMSLGVATHTIQGKPNNVDQSLGDATVCWGFMNHSNELVSYVRSISNNLWNKFSVFIGIQNSEDASRSAVRNISKAIAEKREEQELTTQRPEPSRGGLLGSLPELRQVDQDRKDRERAALDKEIAELLRAEEMQKNQVAISARLKKEWYDAEIRPEVNKVRVELGKLTWDSVDYPRSQENKVLYLASMPLTELRTQITSFEQLLASSARFTELDGNGVEIDRRAERLTLTRKNLDGRVEALEFCFFQGHKMNVFKDGEHIGNLYYGGVRQAAERFWQGKSISLCPVRHDKMVVVPL